MCTKKEGCTRYLGKNKTYSVQRLIEQRNWENAKGVLSTGVLAAMIAGSGFGGFCLVAFSDHAVATATVYAGIAGGAAAGGALTTGIQILTRATPWERFKIAMTLNTEVLSDSEVKVVDVKTFANRLEVTLDNAY